MKKKFYINSNVERFAVFLITLILIIALNIILANTLLKKIETKEITDFIIKQDDMVESYADSVSSKLMQIESRLDSIYAKIAYKNLSTEEIKKFIENERFTLSYPFDLLVYADKNGNSYNMLGEYFPVDDREYFLQIISGEKTFCVSDILESKHDGTSVLVFARAVYDIDHNIKGVLFATCPIENAAKFFIEMGTSNKKRFIIRDRNRRIIHHYDKKWTNWFFSPYRYSDKVFKIGEQNYFLKDTVSTNGELVYLFYKNIPQTTWTIAYSVPQAEFNRIIKNQSKYQNFIIEMIVIALSIIFMVEIWIHSILEKHQILSTNIDPLTHLWTRTYFEREATKLLKRYPKSKFMLIESDIRGFKFINQQYGEEAANKILLQFSKMLFDSTHAKDGMISRSYADHFTVLLRISTIHSAMHFFKTELAKITRETKQCEIPFIPKFGLSFYAPSMTLDLPSIQILISRAAFAKSTIKENAMQQFAIYDEKLLEISKEENFIETHMESSLANNEFFVLYQPKIDLASERVVGAEALVRWQSPVLGYMPPNSFVPLFERNNFIVKLDFYVYEQVFKFIRKCMDRGEDIVPISVNVSRNHDNPQKFVNTFLTLLKKYDISPKLIEVELLERATLDKNLLREITILLQEEGFRVAMDDFGSGESSLNMLSTIPVNILKFDRSFLFAADAENGTLDEMSENFIETLIELGKNLKKETIFEGVETEEQRNFLKKIKCDKVQGYFYSKPLTESEFIEFLKNHR